MDGEFFAGHQKEGGMRRFFSNDKFLLLASWKYFTIIKRIAVIIITT